MKREKLLKPGGVYFDKKSLTFFSSGCKLLDCVLGGGWPVGRIANIVGDKSTGKTLLAIEACANFVRKFRKGRIYYDECEAAFDESYAETLGLPLDKVVFGTSDTVEDLFESITAFCEAQGGQPGLYLVDSLDALSDRKELERSIEDGTYGMGKPKQMAQLFRRMVRVLRDKKVAVLIISQVRDNINAMFGEKHKRSGGRALDFYASQVLWLANMGKIEQTRKGVKLPIGVRVLANCKKNKVGRPFRKAEFPIKFSYGIDDFEAGVLWLADVQRLDVLELNNTNSKTARTKAAKRYLRSLSEYTDKEYEEERVYLEECLDEVWEEVESRFTPERRKYR